MDSTFFGESTGLYFYSAVFQGNMALLALVGVFVVFKLQYISWRKQALEEIITFYYNAAHESANVPIVHDKPRSIEEMEQKEHELKITNPNSATRPHEISTLLIYLDRLKPKFDERRMLISKITEFIAQFYRPFFWTLTVIGLSLILLIFAHAIHNCVMLEIVFFVVTILTNIFSLFYIGKFVLRALQHDE
jgi:hypothetical protein